MEGLQLGVRTGLPLGGADAGRLVDLQVGHAVTAQRVPVAIGEPCGARHGAGLMRRPEAECQPAPQPIAVFHEHARQLHLAGIAGGIVGCCFTGPAVLVTADQHEVVLLRRVRCRRHLRDGDLHGSPAVLDMCFEPHAGPALLGHLAQPQAGRACYADARNGRHFGLGVLRRRIAPHRLHRAKRHRFVVGKTPVHHDGADRAFDARDALLFMARG